VGGPGTETGGETPGDATLPSSSAFPLPLILPVVVATGGAIALGMAVMLFGKRRRDQAQPDTDQALAAAAARGAGVVAGSGLVPARPVVSPIAVAQAVQAVQAAAVAVPMAQDVEAFMPRWRRPSLIEARKIDPTRSVAPSTVNMTFEGRAGDAVAGLERRLIRYRLVRLLDAPDEVRGAELGTLDQGDEVVLLEKLGTYWRVICPDGREGWIHKMTLGDTVMESPGTPAATWTAADDISATPSTSTFEDVMKLYAERRRQAAG
jgi:hypothetical protein